MVIDLQKLLDAALIVNPEEMFKILGSVDEGAQELAKKLRLYYKRLFSHNIFNLDAIYDFKIM